MSFMKYYQTIKCILHERTQLKCLPGCRRGSSGPVFLLVFNPLFQELTCCNEC